MRRRLLLLLLTVPLLAGCGGARAKPELPASAHVDVDGRVTLAGGELRIHGAGVLDGRVLRGRYTVTAAGSSEGGDAAVDLRRLVAYLRQPSLARELAGRRRWVSLDVGRILRADRIDPARLDGVETDGRGRVRSVHTTVELGAARVTVDVVFTPLEARVPVSLPPAADVEDAAAVAERKRARAGVVAAAAALDAYGRAKSGYLGATPRALRRYDRHVDPAVRIVLATQSVYCVELTVGRATAHVGGPDGRALPGPC